ncbi:MAG: phosphatase PAP2 family protein [Ruminococcus sp.]
MGIITQLDGEILIWIQEHLRTPFLNTVFMFITTLGDKGYIWIAASLILMVPKKTRRIGFVIALSLVLSVLFNNLLLKNIFRRPRPFDKVDGLTSLKTPHDYSFPSGHTGSSAAASATMLRELPLKIGIPAVILASLIAFSRMYLGVHYPTDIIGGALSGVLISYVSNWIVDLLYKRFGTEKQAL